MSGPFETGYAILLCFYSDVSTFPTIIRCNATATIVCTGALTSTVRRRLMSLVRSPRRVRRPSTAVVTHIDPLRDHHNGREKKGTRRTIEDKNSESDNCGQRNATSCRYVNLLHSQRSNKRHQLHIRICPPATQSGVRETFCLLPWRKDAAGTTNSYRVRGGLHVFFSQQRVSSSLVKQSLTSCRSRRERQTRPEAPVSVCHFRGGSGDRGGAGWRARRLVGSEVQWSETYHCDARRARNVQHARHVFHVPSRRTPPTHHTIEDNEQA